MAPFRRNNCKSVRNALQIARITHKIHVLCFAFCVVPTPIFDRFVPHFVFVLHPSGNCTNVKNCSEKERKKKKVEEEEEDDDF